MKRCPECRRDYTDETLNYCLDDGATLLDGPGSGDAITALLSGPTSGEASTALLNDIGATQSSRPTKPFLSIKLVALVIAILVIAAGGYWLVSGFAKVKTGPSSAANEKYMRGKVLVMSENRESIDSAIDVLRQAVQDEPQFAAAWAQLARALTKKSFYFSDNDDERRSLVQDAEVAAERSLAIDPNLAEGHFARAFILWSHAKRFPHDLAIQSFKRAIALDPNFDEAHHQLAVIYFHLGLFDKADAEVAKTLEINPSNTLARFRSGVIEMYRGRYEDAYQFFISTPKDQTPSLQAFQLATVVFKLGRVDEADKILDDYLRDNPKDEGGLATSVKAMILAQKGKTAEAQAAITRAEEIGHDYGHFHHTAYNIACAYALMNQPDKAVDYLQQAADDGFPCYPLFQSDNAFKNIRQNPRYIALLAKLKQQWERYNVTV